MNKIKLINQNDYPNKIYITKTEKLEPDKSDGLTTTIKSSGCGICSAMMLAQFFDYELDMDEAIKLSYKSKANTGIGTKLKQYSLQLCDRFNLICERTDCKEKLFECLDNGGCCIANVGGDYEGHIGLFSHIGHYIFIFKHVGENIYILDPGYEPTKYLEKERIDKVNIVNETVISDVKYLLEDIKNRESPLFLFKQKPKDINYTNVFNIIDNLYQEFINIWVDIVKIDSPTNYKQGVDKVGKYIIDFAAKQLWDIEVLENEKAGNAICITMNPYSKLKPIAISGHMDSVHPINSMKTYIKDNRLYGPGCTDCKGGIVVCLLTMKALKDCGYTDRPIKLILQSDEEVSSNLSDKKTIEFMIDKAKDCLCFLNTEMYVKDTAVINRKGIARYEMSFKGKAAHAAYCYEGSSAILEASYKIIELEKMKQEDGITINVGTITGGTTVNTVAEDCKIQIDVRFNDEESLDVAQKYIEDIANKHYLDDVSTSLQLMSKRIAMDLKTYNIDLLDKINLAFEKCGLSKFTARKTNGGSDAAYTSNALIPTIDSIGVSGGRIHSKDEYADLDSLLESSKRMAAIIMNIEE